MDDLTEKQLFFGGCVAPPLVMLALLGKLMHLDPRPFLKAVGPMLPGYRAHHYFEDRAILKLQLSGSADFWKDQIKHVKQNLLVRARTTTVGEGICDQRVNSDIVAAVAGEGSGDDKKVLELWINLHHLIGTAAIPALFLIMYFWDQAVLHREGSKEFPLLSCMDDDTYCFWNNQSYRVFAYPDYVKLDCEEMMDRTINASTPGFHLRAPPSGRFYKCYSLKLSFEDFIGALGDATALTALGGLCILRYSINFTKWKTDSRGAREHMKQIRTSKFWAWFGIVVSLVAFGPSCYLIQWIHGDLESGFVLYLCLPGACAFYIILLCQRLEILQSQEAAVEDSDRTDSDIAVEECNLLSVEGGRRDQDRGGRRGEDGVRAR